MDTVIANKNAVIKQMKGSLQDVLSNLREAKTALRQNNTNFQYRANVDALTKQAADIKKQISDLRSELTYDEIKYAFEFLKNYKPPTDAYVFFILGSLLGLSTTYIAYHLTTPGSRRLMWENIRTTWKQQLRKMVKTGGWTKFTNKIKKWLPTETKMLFKEYSQRIDTVRAILVDLYACLARKKLINSQEVEALVRREEEEEQHEAAKRAAAQAILAQTGGLNNEQSDGAVIDVSLVLQDVPEQKIIHSPMRNNEKYVKLFRAYRSDNLSSLAILSKAITVGFLLANSVGREQDVKNCASDLITTFAHENPLHKAYEIMYFLGEHRAAAKIVQINENIHQLATTLKIRDEIKNVDGEEKYDPFDIHAQDSDSEIDEELKRWWWKTQDIRKTAQQDDFSARRWFRSQQDHTHGAERAKKVNAARRKYLKLQNEEDDENEVEEEQEQEHEDE